MRRDLPPSMRDERVMRIAATRYRHLDDRLLAIMCAESDIRAAGLGALDEKRRRPLSSFYRVKSRVLERAGGDVIYRIGVILPRRAVIQRVDSSRLLPIGSLLTAATATLPAIQLEVRVVAERFDPRGLIARRLWAARRELREERARKESAR